MSSGGLSTALNVTISLGIVIAVVVVAARVARRAGIKGPGADLRVLDRAGLSREASVAVVGVAERRLLLGVTAHGVTLLADLDDGPAAATVPGPDRTPNASAPNVPGPNASAPNASAPTVPAQGTRPAGTTLDLVRRPDLGVEPEDLDELIAAHRSPEPGATTPPAAVHGSVLSPATWRQGVEALRDLTTRKG